MSYPKLYHFAFSYGVLVIAFIKSKQSPIAVFHVEQQKVRLLSTYLFSMSSAPTVSTTRSDHGQFSRLESFRLVEILVKAASF